MSAQRVTAGEPGIVRIDSHHAVAQTVERLEALLKERGIQIFAHFDFTADGARTDLTMRPEQLLIFGSPKAGTPLMQAQPTVGLDLPLKASYLGRRRRSRNECCGATRSACDTERQYRRCDPAARARRTGVA